MALLLRTPAATLCWALLGVLGAGFAAAAGLLGLLGLPGLLGCAHPFDRRPQATSPSDAVLPAEPWSPRALAMFEGRSGRVLTWPISSRAWPGPT